MERREFVSCQGDTKNEQSVGTMGEVATTCEIEGKEILKQEDCLHADTPVSLRCEC